MCDLLRLLPLFQPQLNNGGDLQKIPAGTPIVGRSKFHFAARSNKALDTVKPQLERVARMALSVSAVDFGVIQGKRSVDEQAELVAQGLSQTMASKHLTGDAIDVAAYVDGVLTWESDPYLKIATSFVYAAQAEGVGIRWGGAWHIPDIRTCAKKNDPGQTMLELYKATRKRQGRKVFLDLGHFELA